MKHALVLKRTLTFLTALLLAPLAALPAMAEPHFIAERQEGLKLVQSGKHAEAAAFFVKLFRDRRERGDGPLDQSVMNSDMLATLTASRSSRGNNPISSEKVARLLMTRRRQGKLPRAGTVAHPA